MHAHPDPVDPTLFKQEILPKLATVSAPAIARATGLSAGYCGEVKSGDRVPHPKWWEALSTFQADTPTRSFGPGYH